MSAVLLPAAPVPALGKAALGCEIVAAYVRVRFCLRGRDLPSAVALLRQPGRLAEVPRSPGELATGVRLGHAVARTLSPLPSDTRCLMRSLVLTRLLSRRGIASTLVIGVCAEPEFSAHAWVEADDVALLPPGGAAYRRLVTL